MERELAWVEYPRAEKAKGKGKALLAEQVEPPEGFRS
jgi:hypothetical protein